MRPSVRLLAVLPALGSPSAAAGEPTASTPKSGLLTRLFSAPTSEVPIPCALRTDGKDLFAVSADPRGSFWLFDLASGERRRAVVQPPEGVRGLRVLAVDRIGKNVLVASSRWADGEAARNGLVFFDDDGVVSKVVPQGFAVGSIVVGPTKEWIVGAIQEPQEPTSVAINRPTRSGLAQFTIDGKPITMQGAALSNMMASFEESIRSHRLRRVFLLRGTVILSYPFPGERGRTPVVWIEPRSAPETKAMSKGESARDPAAGTLAQHYWPKLGEEQCRGGEPIGIVPVGSDGKSALLGAWSTRGAWEPEDVDSAAPRRDWGRLLLTLYDTKDNDAKEVQQVEDGIRIGELTSSLDGTAYAVTFRDISREWPISGIDFWWPSGATKYTGSVSSSLVRHADSQSCPSGRSAPAGPVTRRSLGFPHSVPRRGQTGTSRRARALDARGGGGRFCRHVLSDDRVPFGSFEGSTGCGGVHDGIAR